MKYNGGERLMSRSGGAARYKENEALVQVMALYIQTHDDPELYCTYKRLALMFLLI